jgi:outer membrane lipoprotein-sorting protein
MRFKVHWLLSAALVVLCAAPLASGDEFVDEPAAHALYDKMVEAMRAAKTLYYESAYRWEAQDRELGRCRYKAWLKKPNHFRIETITKRYANRKGGVLIGDGEFLWIHWPNGRPHFSSEKTEEWQRSSKNVYMRKATPPGLHSIAHQTSLLGAGMSMTILNPSLFHGCESSMDRYLDGVRGLGTKKVGSETCDGIEVSYMNHQRSHYLWLSRRDHLPRELKQVVRVSYDIISEETWSKITVNKRMPDSKFRWEPPADWKPWRLPDKERNLHKKGETAPDFRLSLLGGGETGLSDYRGKVVWLVFWRVG